MNFKKTFLKEPTFFKKNNINYFPSTIAYIKYLFVAKSKLVNFHPSEGIKNDLLPAHKLSQHAVFLYLHIGDQSAVR